MIGITPGYLIKVREGGSERWEVPNGGRFRTVGGSERWEVPNGGRFRTVHWGFPNTRLITCRSSKEHRDLNCVGECEGSKYVCTCCHLENLISL